METLDVNEIRFLASCIAFDLNVVQAETLNLGTFGRYPKLAECMHWVGVDFAKRPRRISQSRYEEITALIRETIAEIYPGNPRRFAPVSVDRRPFGPRTVMIDVLCHLEEGVLVKLWDRLGPNAQVPAGR